MNSKKIAALFASLILTLSLTGYAYAHWEDILIIEGTVDTAYQDVGISVEIYFDDQNYKAYNNFEGIATAELVDWFENDHGTVNKLIVDLYDVYPCLDILIVMDAHNMGEVPVKLVGWEDEWSDNNIDRELIAQGWYSDCPETAGPGQLDPGQTLYYWWWYHIGNDAIESSFSTYSCEATFYNWNEPNVPVVPLGSMAYPGDFGEPIGPPNGWHDEAAVRFQPVVLSPVP